MCKHPPGRGTGTQVHGYFEHVCPVPGNPLQVQVLWRAGLQILYCRKQMAGSCPGSLIGSSGNRSPEEIPADTQMCASGSSDQWNNSTAGRESSKRGF